MSMSKKTLVFRNKMVWGTHLLPEEEQKKTMWICFIYDLSTGILTKRITYKKKGKHDSKTTYIIYFDCYGYCTVESVRKTIIKWDIIRKGDRKIVKKKFRAYNKEFYDFDIEEKDG